MKFSHKIPKKKIAILNIFDPKIVELKLIQIINKLFFSPVSRYPENWKPAYVAMQLGFIAGGIGLLGRDLLLILTIENWQPIIFSELFFASFVGVGFI